MSPCSVFETGPGITAQHQLSHPNALDDLQAHIQSWGMVYAKLFNVIEMCR